ncbi:MAG: valine--tRNA ligase, partial [Candidatus Eiseniibacteriota bacterium]
MTSATSMKELPSQYDARAQQRWYTYWETRGLFHSEPDPGRRPFTIVIPPPNVTGALHLGHALNNTLQDVVIRLRRMQGYNALWLPGTDHAGIATQAVVERRLLEEEGLSRHDLGRDGLVERIWNWKQDYEERILGQLKRLGCSCDWQRTRFTLDAVCARAVRHFFHELFRERLIYRGKRLVNWDTYLQTAVSDDEVFHETVQGHFWHFRYPIIDPLPGEPTHLSIATTRPETMLGDTAVAVHPDPATALERAADELRERAARAPEKEKAGIAAQLEAIEERRRTMLPELLQLRDMARDGRRVRLPLLGREMPLILDPLAKPELGSGCVKITPAHDVNDYEVGQHHGLSMVNILHPDGRLNAAAGPYEGLTIQEARRRVVADLEREGLLGPVEDREIDLAHSDRSKTPIEPYLADQWFVRMDTLAQLAMDAVEDGRVRIIPERYAKGYLDWLSEKRDWPVGRQLWWGHRMPIWSRAVADEAELAARRGEIERLITEAGGEGEAGGGRLDSWVELIGPATDRAAADGAPAGGAAGGDGGDHGDAAGAGTGAETGAETAPGPHAVLHVCIRDDDRELEERVEGLGYERVPDVLDTWFSSALWPHSTLGWPEQTPELDYYYPTDVLMTSRDIITLWVARMVLAGLHNVGEVPFPEVYIHPKILDGYGETMSKSKGNGVDPLDVIDKFGADALRFCLVYLTTETQDVRMPVEFECPHCQALVEQTRDNRMRPRIECTACGKPFSTQWAESEADRALPRGAVVSERFELGRNFCNKLWNVSRFALMNLEGCTPGPVTAAELQVEDRWILSRLATVTGTVTEALVQYRYADAARMLYDFAWDEFCSFYVEMAKSRLGDETARTVAQRVLAHTLDALLRLLHPIMPFITEEIWQLLAQVVPE